MNFDLLYGISLALLILAVVGFVSAWREGSRSLKNNHLKNQRRDNEQLEKARNEESAP